MEYYSAIKENKILPFATTWMELESIILSRERHIPYNFTPSVEPTCRGEKERESKPRSRLLNMENKMMVNRKEVGRGMG